jgi:hypothetical protein
MKKNHAIGVLFNRSRIPKLTEARLSAVGLPVELNAEKYRYAELEGEKLQSPGSFADTFPTLNAATYPEIKEAQIIESSEAKSSRCAFPPDP